MFLPLRRPPPLKNSLICLIYDKYLKFQEKNYQWFGQNRPPRSKKKQFRRVNPILFGLNISKCTKIKLYNHGGPGPPLLHYITNPHKLNYISRFDGSNSNVQLRFVGLTMNFLCPYCSPSPLPFN